MKREIDFSGNPVHTSWNQEIAVKSISEGFQALNQARTEHIKIWDNVYIELYNKGCIERIKNSFGDEEAFENYINEMLQIIIIFAFISYDSDEDLIRIGLFPEFFRKFSLAHAKINQMGLGTSPLIHRYDDDQYKYHKQEEGHDWISFLQRTVLKGFFDDIQESLSSNLRHEGSHSIIDSLVNKLITPKKYRPSQEGWVVAFSIERNLLLETTDIPQFTTITKPTLEKYQSDFRKIAYLAWPRFFQALYFLVKEEGLNIWKRLSVVMIEAAVDIAKNKSLMEQDDAVKFGNLAKKMIEKLGFEETQVGEKYQEINGDPQRFYDQMVQDRDKGRDEQL